ncbi:hypothetical protein R3P38DRAFT_2582699 [Favolaschia claudopus]|uniref:F-box domain-containing protein n=1 Tax=Favolaschia claudopus TaxID=2862362 RepID=A0AAV9ZAS1_9AGAR
MGDGNPLHIPELVDHCIGFLSTSTLDLMACALVARFWVHPAQSRLFHTPYRTNNHLCLSNQRALEFCRALAANSNLASHVRDLSFDLLDSYFPLLFDSCFPLVKETLKQVYTIQFTHLEHLLLDAQILHLIPKEITQFLQSHAMLRSLGFMGEFAALSRRFADIWVCCPSTIEHLAIYCDRVGVPLSVIPTLPRAPIYLKSFELALWRGSIGGPAPLEQLHNQLYPFNISRLQALSVADGSQLSWATLSIPSLQVLDLEFNLSSFPNLRILRINFLTFITTDVLHIFDSIAPSQHTIHTIVIAMEAVYSDEESTVLDSTLSSMLILPSPIIEVDIGDTWRDAESEFPMIMSRNMVSC